jgi:hypothetical protein
MGSLRALMPKPVMLDPVDSFKEIGSRGPSRRSSVGRTILFPIEVSFPKEATSPKGGGRPGGRPSARAATQRGQCGRRSRRSARCCRADSSAPIHPLMIATLVVIPLLIVFKKASDGGGEGHMLVVE